MIAVSNKTPQFTPEEYFAWEETQLEKHEYIEGQVYATDFRGRDRALEVHFGPHRFRKVVDLGMECQQNDPIWLRLPPEQAYLFERRDGARLQTDGVVPP